MTDAGAVDAGALPRGRSRRQGPSLRALSAVIVPGAALLVLCTAVVLVATTSIIRRTSEAVVRDSYSLELVEDLEADLLRHARVSNLLFGQWTPALAEERRYLESEAAGLVEVLHGLAGTDTEAGQIARVEAEVQSYLETRHQAEREESRLSAVLDRSNPSLNEALYAVGDVELLNQTELQRSSARAEHWDMVAKGAGMTMVAVVLLGVLYSAIVFRRQVARPLAGVYAAVERFRQGEPDVVAPETGAAEIRTIAALFNEGIQVLAERRRIQLAFLAGVAHDLRTPLSALKTGVSMLREQPTGDGQLHADTLARLDRQIDRLARMATDLADATQIESGELHLELRDYDLRDAGREMVGLYAPTCPKHRIDLQIPDEPVPVRADPLRMEEVLSNLLSNAIKYSPDGGPVEVEVSVDAGQAVLSVSDRGVGISPEQHGDVFLPFRRGSNAEAVAPGSGLGLSVVRRIVAAHGGRIEVHSSPGKGSTFCVRLPLVERASTAA